MQIDSGSGSEKVPLQIIMSLNVIQDSQQDGNLFCALSSVANDLLLQIHQKYKKGPEMICKLFWSSVALKTSSKVVIDPQNIQESSLSNNLVMTTGF